MKQPRISIVKIKLITTLTFGIIFISNAFCQSTLINSSSIQKAISSSDTVMIMSICSDMEVLNDFDKCECLKYQANKAFNNGNLLKSVEIFNNIFELAEFDTLTRINDFYTYLDIYYKTAVDDIDSLFKVLDRSKLLISQYSKADINTFIALQTNYAKYYLLNKQFGKSVEINQLIEKSFEKADVTSSQRVGNLINLGNVYLETNNPDVAKEYFEKAIKLAENVDNLPLNYKPALHYSLGRTYQLLNNYSQSEASFEDAKDEFASLFGTREHPALTSCQSYMTENFIRQGLLKESVTNAQIVIEKNGYVYICPSSETMANYLELAKAYYANGDFENALFANSKGFECLDIKMDSLIDIFITDEKYALLKAYAQRIGLLCKMKANREIIEINISVGENLIKSLLSDAYNQSEIRDLSGTISFREFIEACLDFHFSYSVNINEDESFFKSLSYTELVKPRDYFDNNGQIILSSSLDYNYDRDLKILSDSIAKLEIEMFYAKQENSDLNINIPIQEKLNNTKISFNNIAAKLKKEDPAYFNFKFGISDLSAIKSKLKNNEKLLSYFVGFDNIYCFLISNSKLNLVRKKRDYQIERNFKQSRKDLANSKLSLSVELTNYLLGDLSEHLSQDDYLTIIGDLWINSCPFDALPIESGKFLIHRYGIHYTPSVNYTQKGDIPNKSLDNFIAFAPEFKTKNKDVASLDHMRMISDNEYKPLAFSLNEVNEIANNFDIKLFKSAVATKRNFLSELEKADIIHLSTHGKADPIDNDNNLLVFSPEEQDHLFYSKELSDKKLKADMVVLSSCESSLGIVHSGEGILSMSKDFIKAGARSVISTLWSVNDQSTSLIMQYFYENLKLGMRKDEALRQAKIKYIEQHPDLGIDPYYWAGIVANGSMNPISNQKTISRFYLSLLAVTLLLGFLFYKKRVPKTKTGD